MPLSDQQRTFCIEYVKTGNATTAAKSAGYSDKTAHVQGCQLLKRDLIAAEIARLTGRTEKKSELTAEKIMQALNNLVDFDIAQCYDDAGILLPIKQIPLEARKALTGIDLSKPGGHIKSSSRLGAIELSAKLLGMVKEQQTQQQAVQIVIAAPPQLPDVSVSSSKLLPEWE